MLDVRRATPRKIVDPDQAHDGRPRAVAQHEPGTDERGESRPGQPWPGPGQSTDERDGSLDAGQPQRAGREHEAAPDERTSRHPGHPPPQSRFDLVPLGSPRPTRAIVALTEVRWQAEDDRGLHSRDLCRARRRRVPRPRDDHGRVLELRLAAAVPIGLAPERRARAVLDPLSRAARPDSAPADLRGGPRRRSADSISSSSRWVPTTPVPATRPSSPESPARRPAHRHLEVAARLDREPEPLVQATGRASEVDLEDDADAAGGSLVQALPAAPASRFQTRGSRPAGRCPRCGARSPPARRKPGRPASRRRARPRIPSPGSGRHRPRAGDPTVSRRTPPAARPTTVSESAQPPACWRRPVP